MAMCPNWIGDTEKFCYQGCFFFLKKNISGFTLFQIKDGPTPFSFPVGFSPADQNCTINLLNKPSSLKLEASKLQSFILSFNTFLKFGFRIDLSEADTLEYLQKHTFTCP